jgi:hypothetical protein
VRGGWNFLERQCGENNGTPLSGGTTNNSNFLDTHRRIQLGARFSSWLLLKL